MEHDLRTPMKPCVIHLAEQGVYEFITADRPVIHRDCGSYTLLLDMDSEEAIGVQWPDGIKRPEHSAVGLEERVAAALSAPVEDGEIEGLIARLDDFNRVFFDQGNYDRCASCDEIEAALRSLSARLAEAERERDSLKTLEQTVNDLEERLQGAIAERDAAIARAEKAERERNEAEQKRNDYGDALVAASGRARWAEAERDRLAGLVSEAGDMLDGLREEFAALAEGRRSKYKSPNGICAYDNAAVLASRLNETISQEGRP